MLASNSSRLGSYAEIIKDGLPSGRHFYAAESQYNKR